jgi:hypothetical protein
MLRLLDGRVLAAGVNSQIYDPNARAWSATGNLNTPRNSLTITLLPDGRVLATGGQFSSTSTTYFANSELFDPSTNAWTNVAPMTAARVGHSATLLPNGKVFVAGGDIVPTAEIYDPATNVWVRAAVPPAGLPLGGLGMMLTDQTVLTGGAIYNPINDSWKSSTAKGTDGIPLPDGRLLLAFLTCDNCGGPGSSQREIAKATIYDPSTDTSTSLTTGAGSFALSPDGRVLGLDYLAVIGRTTVTPRLFDAVTNTWSLAAPLAVTYLPHLIPLYSGDILATENVYSSGAALPVYSDPVARLTPAIATASISYSSSTLTSILITGTGFLQSSAVNLGTTPLVYTFLGSKKLLAFVPQPLVSSINVLPLTITNAGPGGGTATAPQVSSAPPTPAPPVITGLLPNSGSPGMAVTAVLSGTGLQGATSVTLSGAGVAASIQGMAGDTSLTLRITIDPSAALGPRSVTVATPVGSYTVNSLFTVSLPAIISAMPLPIPDVETGAIRAGYVVITPDNNSAAPTATVTYGIVNGGIVQSQAGILPLPMTTDGSLFVETIPAIGRDLGVAIANPGNTANPVLATLRDQTGTAVGSPVTLSLQPQQQLARFIRELFPAGLVGNGFRGSLELQSSVPFAMLGLRFSGGAFSTVPVSGSTSGAGTPVRVLVSGSSPNTPMAGSTGGSTAVVLPQFAMSGGWATQIALLNKSGTAASGRVDVFDPSGSPMAVQLNGLTQSTFQYSIPAGGTVVLAPRDANGQSPF